VAFKVHQLTALVIFTNLTVIAYYAHSLVTLNVPQGGFNI